MGALLLHRLEEGRWSVFGQTRLALSGRSRLTTPSMSSIPNATFGAILQLPAILSQSRKRAAKPQKAAKVRAFTSLEGPAEAVSRSRWLTMVARSGAKT